MSGNDFKVTHYPSSFDESLDVMVMADSPICKQDISDKKGEEGQNAVASSVTSSSRCIKNTGSARPCPKLKLHK
jgi:hypothetical protein